MSKLNLHSLNPQQRLAVETRQGPVLILAGAGTGKTRVITCRIAHLIQRGTPPGHLLAVTFTNKAAREMLQRVNELLPKPSPRTADEPPPRPTICTFHSLCVRILRQHIERLGYKKHFVIFNESEQLATLKKILSHISSPDARPDPAEALAQLSRFRSGGAQAAALSATDRAWAEHLRHRYESALRACNAVDFDDLILLVLRLFTEHPAVLEACRDRYRFVMVDEYQDTNAAQFQLVHALTREHRNLCVVGDDDQSIYGWRGAEVANLLDLEQHYPEVKVIKLEQNYRSTNTILDAANAVIRHNARRRPKKLWSDKGQGDKILLHCFDSAEAEARTIVEDIELLRLSRRVRWQDQAILFRTNQQARPLETALRQAKVRYHLIGGQSFFDRREIRDFLAYLKTFLNPHDDISLLRIANTPPRGLSDLTMERLLAASHERKESVYASMKNPVIQAAHPARTQEAILAFLGLIEETSQALHRAAATPGARPLRAWAQAFLERTGYLDDLRKSEKDPEAAAQRVRNIQELVDTLDDLESPKPAPPAERLIDFLEELTLDAEREEDEEEAGDAVTLITMHSCKGLEFPYVYIVGLEDGLLPHERSRVEGTLDEERRLFYVALTRAQISLTLSHCASRVRYGQKVHCHPSRFLKELPEELLEHADELAKRPVSVADGKTKFDQIRAMIG